MLGTLISAAPLGEAGPWNCPTSLPLPAVGPTPRAGGEGIIPTVPTPTEAQTEAARSQSGWDLEGAGGLGVEAGVLWLMNEASGQEGKSVGSDCSWSISSGGFQAQRGGRDSIPLALALPQIRVSGGSDRDEHPWPPLLLSEAWLGFGGGVPASP